MARPRVLILRAPGTNCDWETAYAFELAGALPARLHVNRLLENPRVLADFQVFCIPGGFSFGDDVGAGRILARLLQHHLAAELAEFKTRDKLILGICNGFQVLLKSGVLLEPDAEGPLATLTWNDSGRYEDRWVRLRVAAPGCVFLRGLETLYLPVAHAEGKFVTRDPAILTHLEQAGRLVLRYCGPDPDAPASYPDNPNGSWGDTAGVCDATGRVLGLMPHPERHVHRTHHPRWTRGEGREPGDGLSVFRNAVEYFAA